MTTTVNYSWTLPTVGASVNTWGTLVNNILTDIDLKMVTATHIVAERSASRALTNLTGLTVASGGASIAGNVSVTGAVSATSLTVGGSASSGSVQLGDDGGVNSTLASGAGGQVALGNVYGVSNGFVINVASDNSRTYSWTTGSGTQAMTLDDSGNLQVGTSGGSNHIFQRNTNTISQVATFINNAATTTNQYGIVLALNGDPNNSTNYFINSLGNVTQRFIVYSNGNVQNTNNSYGAISDIKHKQDITDATPKLAKLLKVRIVNYKFKSDPNGIKQIGVIAQELEEISPGLIEETPDFEEVEVEPARTETKVTQKQKMRLEESVRYETLLCDGQYRRLPIRTDIEVPLFEFHPLFDETGEPVLEVAEAAIEAQAEVLDEEGNVVTPAVTAKPAVMRQAMHQVPVMEDVTETIEVPAKTERRATGTTTKSVKYSIFGPMLIKALQEQQEQIEALKAKVGA